MVVRFPVAKLGIFFLCSKFSRIFLCRFMNNSYFCSRAWNYNVDCMCVYSVKIDDAVMRRARPHFTLSELSRLKDDWDGYGAPAISRKAMDNCRKVMDGCLQKEDVHIDVMPTEYGGVQVKWALPDGGLLSCDFGDDTMSYYVERKDRSTEYVSFAEYTPENTERLNDYLTHVSEVR